MVMFADAVDRRWSPLGALYPEARWTDYHQLYHAKARGDGLLLFREWVYCMISRDSKQTEIAETKNTRRYVHRPLLHSSIKNSMFDRELSPYAPGVHDQGLWQDSHVLSRCRNQ